MSTTPNTTTDATNQRPTAITAVIEQPRTIAIVAAELEAAIAAAGRVKALTDELHGLLGRKRRARKDAAK